MSHGQTHSNAIIAADRTHLCLPDSAFLSAALSKGQTKERQKDHGGTAPGKQKNTGGNVATSDSGKTILIAVDN